MFTGLERVSPALWEVERWVYKLRGFAKPTSSEKSGEQILPHTYLSTCLCYISVLMYPARSCTGSGALSISTVSCSQATSTPAQCRSRACHIPSTHFAFISAVNRRLHYAEIYGTVLDSAGKMYLICFLLPLKNFIWKIFSGLVCLKTFTEQSVPCNSLYVLLAVYVFITMLKAFP